MTKLDAALQILLGMAGGDHYIPAEVGRTLMMDHPGGRLTWTQSALQREAATTVLEAYHKLEIVCHELKKFSPQ